MMLGQLSPEVLSALKVPLSFSQIYFIAIPVHSCLSAMIDSRGFDT